MGAGCGGSSSSTLNDCTTFADHTAASDPRSVTFGVDGLVYSPKCMEIAAGQTVTFNGDFAAHPLAPGTSPSAQTAGSANNPIVTPDFTSTSAPFTFPTAGSYPYYCKNHFGAGMNGVIKVH